MSFFGTSRDPDTVASNSTDDNAYDIPKKVRDGIGFNVFKQYQQAAKAENKHHNDDHCSCVELFYRKLSTFAYDFSLPIGVSTNCTLYHITDHASFGDIVVLIRGKKASVYFFNGRVNVVSHAKNPDVSNNNFQFSVGIGLVFVSGVLLGVNWVYPLGDVIAKWLL